jgi:hyperosmotically inducible protein
VSPNDDRIRREAFNRIFRGQLARYRLQAVPPIHIIVRNGHITLVGVVALKSESTIAEIKAREVTGAFSVTNKLVVEETSK